MTAFYLRLAAPAFLHRFANQERKRQRNANANATQTESLLNAVERNENGNFFLSATVLLCIRFCQSPPKSDLKVQNIVW